MEEKYKETIGAWNKVAARYEAKFMDENLYDDTYSRLCGMIKADTPVVLEIGCGPGNLTAKLLALRPDITLHGIDVAPNMVELAKKNNPSATFEVLDCRDVSKLNRKFDAIVCGFCLPYIAMEDCCKLFADCFSLLNDDGLFYISAIEGSYDRSGFEYGSSGDRMYVYYYNEPLLEKMLMDAGFTIMELFKKHYQKTPQERSAHLIYIARRL